jgi:small conductance mechanosensitive channel
MENAPGMIQEMLALYGLKVLAAIAILVIGRMVSNWIRSQLRRMMQRSGSDPMLISFASNLTYPYPQRDVHLHSLAPEQAA